MRKLEDEKENIHSCSKCGLCQSVCPVYKITKNDCSVSRGHFIMLSGLIKGDLKMSKRINKYLDLCLKCGACTKFCPSDIDVVDIIALAKAEYFKKRPIEKFISYIQKHIFIDFGLRFLNIFTPKVKSKKFDKKILYFGGCKNKLSGNYAVVKILNACNIEVISPEFDCCGIPFYLRGDLETFNSYKENFYKIIKKYDIKDVVTTCASCEKTLKSYVKWGGDSGINVKNLFEYINEEKLRPKLKENYVVTFHKPCNMNNFETVRKILNNIENMKYVEMDEYDSCCGFNGLSNLKKYKTTVPILFSKRKNIIKTGAKIVLTSCLGCEISLKLFSFFKYKVQDLTEFLAKNIEN